MSVELVTILMFAALLLLLAAGLPISFALGGTAGVFAILLWGPVALKLAVTSIYGAMFNFLFIAIPLFILMANVLERSGVADDLYTMMHRWFGPVRGGLAMGTVLICTAFAAMSGISAAGTVTMGLIALPSMVKRGYDKKLAMGTIMAGGSLGILIPPSIPFILYAFFSRSSVGRLFLAGIVPGIIISFMFIVYIAVRCFLKPHIGPPLPPAERVDWITKFKSLRAVILPVMIILGVLGSIFGGVASPTEAAGIGALGAIVSAAIYRKLNWQIMREAAQRTIYTTAMVMWIASGAICFTAVYSGIGAVEFITNTIEALKVSPWLIIIGMQISLFILGMFLDPTGIMMITLPVYLPVISSLGFDFIWFGVLFVINIEMGYLTPPFGFNLFFMKGVAPKGTSINEIYIAVIPFILILVVGLVLVMVFPNVAMYLPNLLMGVE